MYHFRIQKTRNSLNFNRYFSFKVHLQRENSTKSREHIPHCCNQTLLTDTATCIFRKNNCWEACPKHHRIFVGFGLAWGLSNSRFN